MAVVWLRVAVDFGERGSGVPEALVQLDGVEVVWRRLEAGDYQLGRSTAIERKTSEDFARSIVDGRLFRQMTGLRKSHARGLLLLEDWRPGQAVLNVSPDSLAGALVSVAAVFGVPILFAEGPSDSARLIAYAGRQLQRHHGVGYVRPGHRPRGWRHRALFILQGLPRIGPRRAAALLDRFGSVAAVVGAPEDSLRYTPGIGPETARRLRWAVGFAPASLDSAAPRPTQGG